MKENLEKIGLSPNEVKCYLALLEIGSASANEISRKSGVHRVSVYDALRGLREKGLVSQIMRANKLLFEAGSPQKIKEIISEKESELKEAGKIIPNLLDVFNSSKQKQEIHSFKGFAGVKSLLYLMLDSNTEILDFGAEHKIKSFFPNDYKKWDDERVKSKIKMRIIANVAIKPTKLRLTGIKYVPSEFTSSVSTYIFDNKVVLIMWVESPMAILIEHKTVYQSYKNYFEYLWKTAKK